jgi:serine/threonine-protein kinase
MEFLDGETIAAKIHQGFLKRSEILDVGTQVLAGLAEVHAQGIIHRDIKPQNIIVTNRGIAKILDFGLARITKERALSDTSPVNATTPGTLAGTVQYMSPEQTLGRQVDHRTDVFSLGVTLYEMATGMPPFRGSTPLELMENIRREQPQSITAINPSVSKELERVVTKAMEKDPERRYQSTSEMAADWNALRTKLAESGRTAKWSTRWAVGISIGLAILAIAVVASQFFHFSKTPTPAEHTFKMLVLPFTNISGDADNEYLSDGITEELISALTKVPDMRVVARTSAFALKGKNMDVRELGKMLDVDKVVEGSVQKVGNRLRVSAQLANASDGYHLWSNTYDRNIEDLFAIEDEISNTIARSLTNQLSQGTSIQVAKTPSTNIEAYQQYFQARYLLNKRTPNDLNKGIEHFRQAVVLDPNYAPAYVGLADSFALLASYEYGVMRPEDAIPQARTAAMKALSIDDRIPEAHVSLAQILYQFDWDWDRSEKEFKRALDLNPRYATGHHWYAEFLSARGRFDESIREIESAEMLDPLSLIIQTAHARVLYFARKYDPSIEKYKQAISLEPNFLLAHAGLGYAYAQKSAPEAALAEFQKAIDITGRAPVLLGSLGFAKGLAGNRSEALKLLDELKQISAQTYVMPAYPAAIHLGLDERDQAIMAIEEAYRQKSGFIAFLGVEPAVDKLRTDPRFKNLLLRANIAR